MEYDRTSTKISEKLLSSISKFIEDNYIDDSQSAKISETVQADLMIARSEKAYSYKRMTVAEVDITDVLEQREDTFSKTLFKIIDEKEMEDSYVYKKANMDRRLFSKIRSNMEYRPSKDTVIALSMALELSLDEAKELLRKAGFALSRSNKFDIIVEYFFSEKIYDLFELDEALFSFGEKTLGS